MNEAVNSHKILKWSLIITGAIFFMALVILVSFYFAFENNYKDRVYPGLSMGHVNMSGKTRNQAEYALQQKIDRLNVDGIGFSYQDKIGRIYPIIPSSDSDYAIELIAFDTENSLDQLFRYGHSSNLLKDLKDKWLAYFHPRSLSLSFTINGEKLKTVLTEKFADLDKVPEDAKLTYTGDGQKEPLLFSVQPEKTGDSINFDKAINDLKANLIILKSDTITLEKGDSQPDILKKDCLNIDSKAQEYIRIAPLTLSLESKKWTIGPKLIADWLVLRLNTDPSSDEDKVIVRPDLAQIKVWLQDDLAQKINVPAEDPRFEMKNGKVQAFQTAKSGLALDTAKALLAIEDALAGGEKEIALETNEIKSDLNPDGVNNLGINELLGTGQSKFSGSPANRRHNIRVGADAVNGILIKPDEEFSLIKTLGNIDKAAGYLPELVIKDNKTTPEYGGGLCQIGTTVFRATVKSGLPVTMRYNHSYRVSYYEPAGTDATIYDPFPDYRFVNDTKNYILIQARIKGDYLYFDFWGTKDGRTATSTYPVIYGIVKPEPTKIIETLDLKPGEKKCTEHAHNGANAYFDYTIKYSPENPPKDLRNKADLTDKDLIKKKRFNSHYVPWQEVCLVGVEKISVAQGTKKAATSTAEKLN